MGRIGTVLEFIKETVQGITADRIKTDLGGNDIRTANYVQPANEDARPLPQDQSFNLPGPKTGSVVAVGFVDTYNESTVGPGEKRIYGRSESGEIVSEVFCKNTGEIQAKNENIEFAMNPDGSGFIENDMGSFNLNVDGSVEINGVIIDAAGNLTVPGNISGSGSLAGGGISATAGVMTGTDFQAGPVSLATHVHGGVTPGGGTTGTPI